MKKRLLIAVLIVLSFGLLLVALIVLGDRYPSLFICPVRRIFHLKCPGCGMTSAIEDIFKTDFSSAFRHNMMFVPILLYLAYLFVPPVVRYVKKGEKKINPEPMWVNVAFLAVFAVWAVARNVLSV